MKSCLLGAAWIFTLAILSTTAHAALVAPAGHNPGDPYHVIFVSSTTRDATSSDIADYDAHVQAAADAAGIGGSTTWLAVGSTETVDAVDHLSPLFSSTTNVPIYNQNGDLVALSLVDLFTSNLVNAIVYNEFVGPWGFSVFTGTGFGGVKANPLGTQSVTLGHPYFTVEQQWVSLISSPTDDPSFPRPIYGLSEEITVQPVPIPAAACLFGSGLLGLIGIARRKAA